MKKILSFLSVLSIVFCFTMPVFADIIAEPYDDFYQAHATECTSVDRSFFTKGPDGFVEVKKAPDDKTVVATLPNDSLQVIMFVCDYKGVSWGVGEFRVPSSGDAPDTIEPGWIPMEQMVLKYDSQSFKSDHEKEIVRYTGDSAFLDKTKQLVLWTYPESGESSGTLDNTMEYKDITFEYSYTDPNGRQWLNTGYFQGMRDIWVCATEPEKEELSGDTQNPETGIWQTPESAKKGLPVPIVAVVLVGVLVLGTAILIGTLWKPQR